MVHHACEARKRLVIGRPAQATYLTHPASQQRIDAALDAARGFESAESDQRNRWRRTEGAGKTFDPRHAGGRAIARRRGEASLAVGGVFTANGEVLRASLLDSRRNVLKSTLDTGRWALSGDVMTSTHAHREKDQVGCA
jgi:hypothetical protein